MSLELPSYLQWLGWVAGSAWPEGDEDRMWGIADTWNTAAQELRDMLPEVSNAKAQTIAAYPWGNGSEVMTAALNKLDDGNDDSIQHLADIFGEVGESAFDLGTEIQYTKIMIISSLGLLAVEIAVAWGFPPTAAITEAIETAVTRTAIRILGKEAVERIGEFVEKRLLGAMMKFLAEHVLFSTVIGTAQDFGIQWGQDIAGTRHGIDWKQVGVTALESAVAGAVGGPAGEVFDKGLSKIALPEGVIANALGRTLKGAVVGTGAGIAGGLAAWGTGGFFYGWQWDNHLLTSTASFGTLVGGSKGFRGQDAGTSPFGKAEVPDAAGIGGDGSVPGAVSGNGGPHGYLRSPDTGAGLASGSDPNGSSHGAVSAGLKTEAAPQTHPAEEGGQARSSGGDSQGHSTGGGAQAHSSAGPEHGMRPAIGPSEPVTLPKAGAQVADLAQQRAALTEKLPEMRAAIKASAIREGVPADAERLTNGTRAEQREHLDWLRGRTMQVNRTPEEIEAGRPSEMTRKQGAIDDLEKAVGDYNAQRDKIFGLTDRITQVSGEDYLGARGARIAGDRVGVVDGEHPIVIVMGLRGGSSGMPTHDELLAGAAAHDPALADALGQPGTRVEYTRITTDSEGNTHVQPLKSPTPAQIAVARANAPKQEQSGGQQRGAASGGSGVAVGSDGRGGETSGDPGKPSGALREEEVSHEPNDPATADTPYTTRGNPETVIPPYTAPSPPPNTVWDNPNPPHPRPHPGPHPKPEPRPGPPEHHPQPRPHPEPEPPEHHRHRPEPPGHQKHRPAPPEDHRHRLEPPERHGHNPEHRGHHHGREPEPPRHHDRELEPRRRVGEPEPPGHQKPRTRHWRDPEPPRHHGRGAELRMPRVGGSEPRGHQGLESLMPGRHGDEPESSAHHRRSNLSVGQDGSLPLGAEDRASRTWRGEDGLFGR
ncbi:hypothetical protein ABIA39_004348 [Nocardia sp. GAS34]|uniref:WXG100-like domain-containing protein n=1 Tax=unclassified Nocardia TaxID=2637762 RepID=UPI003D2075E0